MTYPQLVEKLEVVGISEKEINVRDTLSRRKYSAAFLPQCLNALQTTEFCTDA